MTDWNWYNWVIFLPSLLPSYHKKKKKKEKSEFWKNEKSCRIHYHFTYVYQKPKSYDLQFLRYGVERTGFFVILDNFLPSPLKSQKIKILKKMGKALGDIIRANKGWLAVSYLQSPVFDHPNLSYDDHCNHWLFQKIFFLLIYFLFPRNCS